jgi:hypothetical protein
VTRHHDTSRQCNVHTALQGTVTATSGVTGQRGFTAAHLHFSHLATGCICSYCNEPSLRRTLASELKDSESHSDASNKRKLDANPLNALNQCLRCGGTVKRNYQYKLRKKRARECEHVHTYYIHTHTHIQYINT